MLRSREDSLVAFTLTTQGAVGAFFIWFLSTILGGRVEEARAMESHPGALMAMLFGLLVLQTFALVTSTLHLGKPQFCYRALNNLRHSWISREILTTGIFYQMLGGYALVTVFPVLLSWLPPSLSHLPPTLLGWGGAVVGPLALYCMSQCYRIKARPFWDHWHVYGAFFASALILGCLVVGFLFGAAEQIDGRAVGPLLGYLALPLLFSLLLQGVSLVAHFRYLKERGDEAAVSRMLLCVTFGKLYITRYISWGILTLLALFFLVEILSGGWGLVVWGLMTLLALAHEVFGRFLFYAAVVPTSHPGSFFFGNNVFVTHAQKTGLANMPQTGVPPKTT